MVAPQVSKVKGSTRGSFLRALKLLCLRQVLYSEDGYTYLDVRPELEVQEVGKVKGSVNIPIMNATRKYDPEQKKKVTQKSPNEAFADMVKKRFPDPETKLLVACSDGRKYSMDALTALDEAGYVNIAGLKVLACVKQQGMRHCAQSPSVLMQHGGCTPHLGQACLPVQFDEEFQP